jgi:hypothetical protein
VEELTSAGMGKDWLELSGSTVGDRRGVFLSFGSLFALFLARFLAAIGVFSDLLTANLRGYQSECVREMAKLPPLNASSIAAWCGCIEQRNFVRVFTTAAVACLPLLRFEWSAILTNR